jgi:hypothetical protein
MSARWQLTIEESFSIRGRGTVIVGTLVGTGHNEAAVVTTPAGQSFHIARVVFGALAFGWAWCEVVAEHLR